MNTTEMPKYDCLPYTCLRANDLHRSKRSQKTDVVVCTLDNPYAREGYIRVMTKAKSWVLQIRSL